MSALPEILRAIGGGAKNEAPSAPVKAQAEGGLNMAEGEHPYKKLLARHEQISRRIDEAERERLKKEKQ